MKINPISQNQTSFRAKLDLVADKRCLPKGAIKRLDKLAQKIGTSADTIVIGIYPEITDKTIVRQGLFGCRHKDSVIGSFDTSIFTSATCPSKGLYIPLVNKIISGTKYPNAVRKYCSSKEIRMNNYKEIYRYLLDLKDKFKLTV